MGPLEIDENKWVIGVNYATYRCLYLCEIAVPK